jgi:hypothetical protein
MIVDLYFLVTRTSFLGPYDFSQCRCELIVHLVTLISLGKRTYVKIGEKKSNIPDSRLLPNDDNGTQDIIPSHKILFLDNTKSIKIVYYERKYLCRANRA